MNWLRRWFDRWFTSRDTVAASLRSVNGQSVPETGRSSVEGTMHDRLSAATAFWGGVSPVIDFQMLSVLKHLWLYNPDFSQFVVNIVNLANTGHKLTVDASSKRRAEQAVARMNETASRIYRIGAGVDGLLNAYLAQAAWSGAVSSEDVINFGARRVDRVALVPVEQIRFRYIGGEYVPHQQPGVGAGLLRSPLGLIRLNPVTYRYYAWQTVDNSPYAKPPGTAAVETLVGPQKDMVDNISFVAKKLGLLGVVSIAVTRPEQEDGETPQQYQARAQTYLASVGSSAEKMSNKGLIVTYEDQVVKHDSVTSDARGAYDVFRMTSERGFSGLGSFPAFHGRTDSTTETYADVVYNLLLAQAGNFQRLVKRRQESTYRLDLALGGLLVDGVSLGFNREKARNMLEHAQAEYLMTQTALQKAASGVISPDDAARELGYESAFDPELMKKDPDASKSLRRMSRGPGVAGEGEQITLQFDRLSQMYKFVPQTIQLNGGGLKYTA